ncbi:MAG: TlpA family protein disulfide reductase [Rickettsiales bacterium]|nr:TlpA family protein disulfide reductase [Rickettsiales bacterium]
MKIKLFALLTALLFLCGSIFYGQFHIPEELIPERKDVVNHDRLASFPNIAFKTIDGNTLRINDMTEKTILIHFWAAWCAVCQTEFPALLKYIENGHGEIGLVSISLDNHYEDSQKALTQIAKKEFLSLRSPHLYWIWDEDKSLSLRTFNTIKVPETLIINNKRLMIDKIVGAGQWDKQLYIK